MTKSDAGVFARKFESLDEGATIPLDTVSLRNDDVRFESKDAGFVFQSI